MSALSRSYEERDGSVFEAYDHFTIEYRDASHRYWLHKDMARVPVASVTTVLKVLDRPQLDDWRVRQTAEGTARLIALGLFDPKVDDPTTAAARVREAELGDDAKKEAGGDRGTAIHRVLELWARERTIPDVGDFPAEQRGYVQGLCAWLLQTRPEPTSVERIVGSLRHMYAGRMDLRALIAGVDTIVDLKTSPSGAIYPEGHLQSVAYAVADQECGAPKPDRVLIVGVGADGSFTQTDCEATERDWLNVLAAYRSMQRLKTNIRVAAAA